MWICKNLIETCEENVKDVLRGIKRVRLKGDLWWAGCDLNPKWTIGRRDEPSLQLRFDEDVGE